MEPRRRHGPVADNPLTPPASPGAPPAPSPAPAASATVPQAVGRPGPSLGRLRLWSGLVVAVFVVTHFANHIAGVFLVEAMDDARPAFMAIWRTVPGTVILYSALLTHIVLSLAGLWRRRAFTLTRGDWWQLGLGLAVPFVLIGHLVEVLVASNGYGVATSYQWLMLTYVMEDPARGTLMLCLVVVVWAHLCLGIHFWLRMRPWYRRARPALAAVAIVFPALTLAGLLASGTDLGRRVEQRPMLAVEIMNEVGATPSALFALRKIETAALMSWVLVLGGLLAARSVREAILRRRNPLEIVYASGRTVAAPHGVSVLEASRIAGLAHAATCGGRGRCSTCRVQILSSTHELPPPGPQERETLRRIGADPSIRLACQLRPRGRLEVRPLVASAAEARHPALAGLDHGREVEIAVLTVDLRQSSRLAEHRLPFDVLYVVDRFLNAVLGAMRTHGGEVVSLAGDGAVAVFGLEMPVGPASRAAVDATLAVFAAVERLNEELAADLPWPLEFAAGLDAGSAIVGNRPPDATFPVQFVGTPGNVAARLEELAKARGAAVVLSRRLADLAGISPPAAVDDEVVLRGYANALAVCVFADRGSLAAAAGVIPATPSIPSADAEAVALRPDLRVS